MIDWHYTHSGNYVQVHDTFLNLGPIVDFCVVDLERQGQGQIVTCSGAYKDGSLRIIRNGIGLNVAAAIELPAIRGLWALKKYEMDDYDSLLIAAQVGETRIFHVGEEWEEGSLGGFEANLQSLFCGNVAHGQLLQITSRSVRLIAAGGETLVTEWQAPAGDVRTCSLALSLSLSRGMTLTDGVVSDHGRELQPQSGGCCSRCDTVLL